MTTESLIQNQIRVGLSQAGHMVFRANVGKVKTADGRFFDTGLPKGFVTCLDLNQTGKCFLSKLKMKQVE